MSKTRCVAVIQCQFSHERCTGAHCAKAFAERGESFQGYGAEAIYYVPFSCGGCSGRRVGRLATQLRKVMSKKAGVPVEEIAVHLATCMVTDNGHHPPCPHLDSIRLMLDRQGLRVVEGTHFSAKA
jgi:predicted metal-binding protein